MHTPPPLSVHLSLSLFLWYPIPFSSVISDISLRFGDVDVFFLQSKVLCTDAVVPSIDHCCIETVSPSTPMLAPDKGAVWSIITKNNHYCIDIVVPSRDHCCTETVPPSSNHYGTTNVVPPSDHSHAKIT